MAGLTAKIRILEGWQASVAMAGPIHVAGSCEAVGSGGGGGGGGTQCTAEKESAAEAEEGGGEKDGDLHGGRGDKEVGIVVEDGDILGSVR